MPSEKYQSPSIGAALQAFLAEKPRQCWGFDFQSIRSMAALKTIPTDAGAWNLSPGRC